MLALDSSIGCIEASESQILDLYRSAPVIKCSSASSMQETMEAYVCAIKKKTQIRVYLALVADDKKIFVYTPPGKPESESGYRQAFDNAVACARAMGFSPEPVDLNYSPALREVVVRNTKILRPPGSKAAAFLKHGMSGAPALPHVKEAHVEPAVSSTAASSVATAAAPTAPPGPAAAAAAESQAGKMVQLERTISELIKQLQALTAERDAQSVQLGELSEQQQATSAELAGAREECGRLKVQREGLVRYQQQCEELAREKGALEAKLEELAKQHQGVQSGLSGAKAECVRLLADKEAMVQAANDAEEASAHLCSLQKEFAELSGRHQETERLCLELRDERSALAEDLALARQEGEAAVAERDQRLEKAERLVEASREAGVEMAAVRNELAALRSEKENALQRVEALEKQNDAAEEELAALRRELALLFESRREPIEKEECAKKPVTPAAQPDAAAGEETPLQAAETENEPSAETVQPEAGFPAFTLEQNVAELGVLEMSTAGSGADPAPAPSAAQLSDREREFAYYCSLAEEAPASDTDGQNVPPLAEQTHAFPPVQPLPLNAHDFAPLADLQADFFSACSDGGAPLRFTLDPSLPAIRYSGAEEVLELHQSINNANLAPDGKGQENCRGYICGLKRGGSLLVFAAIHGTKSGRTSVYLPEEQPKDDSSYASAVRGAIAFAEEVGLMMEPVMLDSPERRDECIKKCPALTQTGQI